MISSIPISERALELVVVIVRLECVIAQTVACPEQDTDNDSPDPFIIQILRYHGFGDVAALD